MPKPDSPQMNSGLYARAGASAMATAAACEKRFDGPVTNVSKVYLGFSPASRALPGGLWCRRVEVRGPCAVQALACFLLLRDEIFLGLGGEFVPASLQQRGGVGVVRFGGVGRPHARAVRRRGHVGGGVWRILARAVRPVVVEGGVDADGDLDRVAEVAFEGIGDGLTQDALDRVAREARRCGQQREAPGEGDRFGEQQPGALLPAQRQPWHGRARPRHVPRR
ncbi:hypothetical protein GCM10023353_00810 [Tomitella cavernea]|uniref:Uncharacterized protein n=1 Tax=Tomitella cavernea TaxID=1387982 RepID=A0ABP9C295_9ACTN